jgi:hypothetical protein
VDYTEIIKARHSVRRYTDKKIEGETLEELNGIIDLCNRESGLNIQLYLDEPEAFSGRMAKYGRFHNVRNYLVLAGKRTKDFDEKCGYYGEKIVLEAQRLGLNTCWVALTYNKSKRKTDLASDEKVMIVIAIGYGENQGVPHKSKPLEELYRVKGEAPEWFLQGVRMAQLAPTSINQQKFLFTLEGNTVKATAGLAFYSKLDLGIVKYHFEIGAAGADWQWG